MLLLPFTLCSVFSHFTTALVLPSDAILSLSTVKNASFPTIITNITTSNALPFCWPTGRENYPISPDDCDDAIVDLISRGGTLPVVWTSQRQWHYRTCSILLIPNDPGVSDTFQNAQDTFSRLDIARVAKEIKVACINEEHGFRGGVKDIGPQRVFYLSVENDNLFTT